MANHIIDAMLPNEQGDYHKIIHKISLHEGAVINAGIFCIFCIYDIFNSDLDGDQLVDFYWIDPLFAAERIAAKSKYAGNLYLQFEPEDSWERPGVRAFGRVNGGLVFEAAYFMDMESVPMLSVFYADKAHWKGMTHHPVYRECIQFYLRLVNIFDIFCITMHCLHILYNQHQYANSAESLLNIKEDHRAKPSSWYAVGWMPIIDEDKSKRKDKGYDSNGARNVRIYHECWRHFLSRFYTDAKESRVIFYGDGKARKTRHSIGAFLGDQQVCLQYFLNIVHIF